MSFRPDEERSVRTNNDVSDHPPSSTATAGTTTFETGSYTLTTTLSGTPTTFAAQTSETAREDQDRKTALGISFGLIVLVLLVLLCGLFFARKRLRRGDAERRQTRMDGGHGDGDVDVDLGSVKLKQRIPERPLCDDCKGGDAPCGRCSEESPVVHTERLSSASSRGGEHSPGPGRTKGGQDMRWSEAGEDDHEVSVFEGL